MEYVEQYERVIKMDEEELKKRVKYLERQIKIESMKKKNKKRFKRGFFTD